MLSGLKELKTLVLWGNRLEGAIPVWLDRMTNLESLVLYGNRFVGELPL